MGSGVRTVDKSSKMMQTEKYKSPDIDLKCASKISELWYNSHREL